MSRTTFGAIVAVVGVLIAGGLYLNHQRDPQLKAAAAAAAEAKLRDDIAGCGRGTGRWGSKVHEMRDASSKLFRLTPPLSVFSDPRLGESEAVLVAWLECEAKVRGRAPYYTVFEKEGRRVYQLPQYSYSYHAEGGRIVAITRVLPR